MIPITDMHDINRQSTRHGWRIIVNPVEGVLLRRYIVVGAPKSPDAPVDGYQRAWELCVHEAWNEVSVAVATLDFIREHSAKEYVDMIYHAHGVTKGRIEHA